MLNAQYWLPSGLNAQVTCADVPNAYMGTWRGTNLYLPFHSLLGVRMYPGHLSTGLDGAFRCQCSGDSVVCPSAVWQRQLIRSVIRVLAVIMCTGSACSVVGTQEQVMASPTCASFPFGTRSWLVCSWALWKAVETLMQHKRNVKEKCMLLTGWMCFTDCWIWRTC